MNRFIICRTNDLIYFLWDKWFIISFTGQMIPFIIYRTNSFQSTGRIIHFIFCGIHDSVEAGSESDSELWSVLGARPARSSRSLLREKTCADVCVAAWLSSHIYAASYMAFITSCKMTAIVHNPCCVDLSSNGRRQPGFDPSHTFVPFPGHFARPRFLWAFLSEATCWGDQRLSHSWSCGGSFQRHSLKRLSAVVDTCK